MINWLKKNWLLTLILVLALVLRLYRISATQTFLEDEGRDLLIVKRMLDTKLPVLLGPQTSTGNMYLGPLYYYLITPSLFLSRMNPVGPAIFVALSGVLTSYLLFYLGRKWFALKSGYVSALLFAILPFSVAVTRASWNPNLVPLVTVLMLITYDHLRVDRPKWQTWLWYGCLIGTMIQLHYMALIFCAVLSLALVWHHRHNLARLVMGIATSLIGFILVLSPFIFFEYRNDWVNTHALIKFITPQQGQNIRYNLPLWLWWEKVSTTSYRVIGNTLIGSQITGVNQTLVIVAIYLLMITFTYFSVWKKRQSMFAHLLIILAGCLSILGIYQENIHMHYLEFIIPLIILTLGGILQHEIPKYLSKSGMLFIVVVIAFGFPRTLGNITSSPTHQAEKARDVANYIIKQAGGRPYNVVSTQGMYTTPFQYYLAISQSPPSNELTDLIFDICDSAPCVSDEATTTLLFLTGPAHPSIAQYLGHPQINEFSPPRTIVSNEHVSYGLWVAQLMLK